MCHSARRNSILRVLKTMNKKESMLFLCMIVCSIIGVVASGSIAVLAMTGIANLFA